MCTNTQGGRNAYAECCCSEINDIYLGCSLYVDAHFKHFKQIKASNLCLKKRLRTILSIFSCIYSPWWCESESVAGWGLHGPPALFWCPPWPGWPVLCATQLDGGEGHLCWLYWLIICCLGTWLLFDYCLGMVLFQLIIHIYYSVYLRSLKCPCSLMVWYYGNDWHRFIVMSSLLVWTEHIVGFGNIPTALYWHAQPFKVNI